eukprot:3923308-Amphidinium_carterae.1
MVSGGVHIEARSVDVLALRTAARKMEQLLEQITGQKPAPLHHELLHAGLEVFRAADPPHTHDVIAIARVSKGSQTDSMRCLLL